MEGDDGIARVKAWFVMADGCSRARHLPSSSCQEGSVLLPHGSWRKWHWYVSCSLLTSTGKTTFVNTLCDQNVIEHKDSENPSTANVEMGLQIQPVNLGMCSMRGISNP